MREKLCVSGYTPADFHPSQLAWTRLRIAWQVYIELTNFASLHWKFVVSTIAYPTLLYAPLLYPMLPTLPFPILGQGAFRIDPMPNMRQGLLKFMPSRPQFYAVFALVTRCSSPISCRLHTSMLQNFKTNAEDLRRNPNKMQPGSYPTLPYATLLYPMAYPTISYPILFSAILFLL